MVGCALNDIRGADWRTVTMLNASSWHRRAASSCCRATGFSMIGRLITAEATPKNTESHHTTS